MFLFPVRKKIDRVFLFYFLFRASYGLMESLFCGKKIALFISQFMDLLKAGSER